MELRWTLPALKHCTFYCWSSAIVLCSTSCKALLLKFCHCSLLHILQSFTAEVLPLFSAPHPAKLYYWGSAIVLCSTSCRALLLRFCHCSLFHVLQSFTAEVLPLFSVPRPAEQGGRLCHPHPHRPPSDPQNHQLSSRLGELSLAAWTLVKLKQEAISFSRLPKTRVIKLYFMYLQKNLDCFFLVPKKRSLKEKNNNPKTTKSRKVSPSSSHFSPFNCCLKVVLQLDKGKCPQNLHVVFCPNK